ncbi:hypothetical protein GCM10027288_54760 [Bordetella tumbae]
MIHKPAIKAAARTKWQKGTRRCLYRARPKPDKPECETPLSQTVSGAAYDTQASDNAMRNMRRNGSAAPHNS